MQRGLFNIALPDSSSTGASETVLVERGLDRTVVSYVSMTNTSATDVTVELFIDDGNDKSHMVKTAIPASVTLVITEGLSFQNATFELVLRTSSGVLSTSTPLSVIVK
jgi:hypothetical protein